MNKTLNYRAVLAGLAVNLLGSFIGSILVLNVYASRLVSSGMTTAEVEKAIMDALMNPNDHAGLFLALLATGAVFDALSGYVTARRAGYLELWHVLALVGLLAVMQVGAGVVGGGVTVWYWLALISTIAAAFWGGWRAKIRRLKMESGT